MDILQVLSNPFYVLIIVFVIFIVFISIYISRLKINSGEVQIDKEKTEIQD